MPKKTVADYLKDLHRIELETARAYHGNGKVHARIMAQAARLRESFKTYRSLNV